MMNTETQTMIQCNNASDRDNERNKERNREREGATQDKTKEYGTIL